MSAAHIRQADAWPSPPSGVKLRAVSPDWMEGILVAAESQHAPLEKREPGSTDLRVFTTELIPPGRQRVDLSRPRLRVTQDRLTGRPVLRTAVLP